MYLFHYLCLVSAGFIFTMLNQKLINHRYLRFAPLACSLGCILLLVLVSGLLNDLARFNRWWNFVYIILYVLLRDFASVGSTISIIYLIDSRVIQKLIEKVKEMSYLIQGAAGLLFGVNVPIFLFYITEIQIYDWLPNYSPYKNQKELAIFIIIAFIYWQILTSRHLLNSKRMDKKKLVLSNILIFMIATGIGIYIQRFNLVHILT